MVSSGIALPDNPEELILPAGRGGGATGVQALPDDAQVCSCNNVSKGEITGALDEHDCEDVAAVKKCTGAGTTCGSCVGTVKAIVEDHFARAGKEVSRALCEHFGLSRSELFEVVAIHGHRTFDEIVEAHGTGRG
jgi:nitrite reductase (NADH) large subunit